MQGPLSCHRLRKERPPSNFAAGLFSTPARAQNLTISPEAQRVLDTIYAGNPDAAIPLARKIEQAHPDDPLGYLLEGEALWWNRYCAACEVKYGIVEFCIESFLE